MPTLAFEPPSLVDFVLVTVLVGGWTAWMTGRAVALGWGSALQTLVYCALLGAAVRFIHFALFGGVLLSLPNYLLDFAVVAALGLLGHRMTRVRQMITQYRWLYERAGPLSWRDRPGDVEVAPR